MTLPITDEQARQIAACDGTAYLGIPGVAVPAPGWGGTATTRPPAEWVALAEATCETCGEFSAHKNRCPDCVDGKPIHTLTVDCDRCGGLGTLGNYDTDDYDPCPACGPDDWPESPGFVSVDVVVAELLRFTTRDDATDGCLFEWGESFWRYTPDDDGTVHVTPCGPPLQPGDWVAELKVPHDR